MTLRPKSPKQERTIPQNRKQNIEISKRDQKLFVLRQKKRYGVIDKFEEGQLSVLESGRDIIGTD